MDEVLKLLIALTQLMTAIVTLQVARETKKNLPKKTSSKKK